MELRINHVRINRARPVLFHETPEKLGQEGVHPCLISGSWNHLIDLKQVFSPNYLEFSPCETQKIILLEVRFNPFKVRLNIQKLEKSENWNFEI